MDCGMAAKASMNYHSTCTWMVDKKGERERASLVPRAWKFSGTNYKVINHKIYSEDDPEKVFPGVFPPLIWSLDNISISTHWITQSCFFLHLTRDEGLSYFKMIVRIISDIWESLFKLPSMPASQNFFFFKMFPISASFVNGSKPTDGPGWENIVTAAYAMGKKLFN